MKIERVAIFGLDFPNIINQIMGLREGFRQIGVDVLAAWPHPNVLVLENVLDSFRPDVVFEINRSRNQIPEFDDKFLHICWMQDIQSLGERLDVNFGGSDLAYFMLPPSASGYPAALDGTMSHLMAATDPDIFTVGTEQPIFDFSFVGQIFAPISDQLRARPIIVRGEKCGTFGDVFDRFEVKGISHSTHTASETVAELVDFVRTQCPDADAAMIDDATKNIFDEYLPRMTERSRMLKAALGISNKAGFFGTGPWDEWPEFRGHFGGYINRPRKMATIFRRTKVNLHNGGGTMMCRVLDCMATGSTIMVGNGRWDGTVYGLDHYFEAGSHYYEYDFDTFEPTARIALEDNEARRRIGAAAAEAVRANHTWRHRAEQIIRDVASL